MEECARAGGLPSRLPEHEVLLKHFLDCLGGQTPCRYRPLGKFIGERPLNSRRSRSQPAAVEPPTGDEHPLVLDIGPPLDTLTSAL